MPPIRVLIADDEPEICTMLQQWLATQPWEVEILYSGKQALDRLRSTRFNIAVIDLMMPDLDGLQIFRTLVNEEVKTDVVFLTGYGTVDKAVQAMKLGAKEFLQKPTSQVVFIETLWRLIEQQHPSPDMLAFRLDMLLAKRYTDASLTLADVAAWLSISPRYVSRLFRECLNTTFRQRLTSYRIERARSLLMSTDEPFYVIAELCGFKNYYRLAEAFRRLVGMSPGQYRKKHRNPFS